MAAEYSDIYTTPNALTAQRLRAAAEYAQALKGDFVGNPLGAAAAMINSLNAGNRMDRATAGEIADLKNRGAAGAEDWGSNDPAINRSYSETPWANPGAVPAASAAPNPKVAFNGPTPPVRGGMLGPDTTIIGGGPETPSGGSALAFNGPGSTADASGATVTLDGTVVTPEMRQNAINQRMAQVLSGRSPGGPGGPLSGGGPPAVPARPTAPVVASPAGNYIDPTVAPQRPKITKEQYKRLLSDPTLTEADRTYYRKVWFEQHQPIEMDYMGNRLLISPDGRHQQLIPVPKSQAVEGKGAKYNEAIINVPDGKGGFIQKVMPRQEAPDIETPAAPSRGGGPAPAPRTDGSEAPSMNTPAKDLLKYSPEGPQSGDLKSWLANPAGPLTAAPPPAPEGTTQVAGGLPPKLRDMIRDVQDLEYEQNTRTKQTDADIAAFQKHYDQVGASGVDATKVRPSLEMARSLVDNKNFYSGFGSGFMLPLKQLEAQFSDNPNAAAAMETFKKLTSGALIGDMRAQLAGLGQVRIAEIDLLTKAMGNLDYTRPSNRIVLDLAIRANKQIAFLAKMAAEYKEGTRWDEKGQPYKSSERPTSSGLNKVLQTWAEKTALTREEIADYNKKIEQMGGEEKKPARKGAAPPPKPIGTELPPGVRLD